jgi:type I restriction enzyme S subunit
VVIFDIHQCYWNFRLDFLCPKSILVPKNINILLPPLAEQKRIVAILDKAFESIARAKESAEKNLKNAKEIFESYLQSVFENKGEGWEEKKLIDICNLVNGRAYNKKELLKTGKYTVLRVGNFFTNKHWYYSDLELPEDKYCDRGDLLYAWSASFGPRIWDGEKVIYHYHIWKVIPNLNLVSKEFLFILLEWDKEKIKAAQGTGTTMIHVSKGSMEERIIPLPNLKEQQIIVSNINALSAETKKLEAIYTQKLTDLEELKKSILTKAFNGELTEASA